MTEYLTPKKFSLPLDKAAVARDWRVRGYSCLPFTDPPGRCWEDFVHDCNELVTVIGGKLEMEIDGTKMTMQPGDEVFIPQNAHHSVRNVHDDTTHWLYGYD